MTQKNIGQDRFCSQHRTAVVGIQNDAIKRLCGFGGNGETKTPSFSSLIKVTKFVILILTVKNCATDRERK
jgi:hypothetical protein